MNQARTRQVFVPAQHEALQPGQSAKVRQSRIRDARLEDLQLLQIGQPLQSSHSLVCQELQSSQVEILQPGQSKGSPESTTKSALFPFSIEPKSFSIPRARAAS